jgi:hypothetical protein
MTPNPYLSKYPNSEIGELVRSGSSPLRFDSGYNELIDKADVSIYSSSFTMPLSRLSFDTEKVRVKFDANFTELT